MTTSLDPPRSWPRAPGGLAHIGLLHDDVDELVDLVLPHLTSAIHHGDPVTTMVDRRTGRALRTALGASAAQVAFATPRGGEPSERVLRRLGAWVRPTRRSVIVCQHATASDDAAGVVARESEIDLALADVAVTVLCAYPRDGGSATAAARACHPYMAGRGGLTNNPRYRPPADRCPTAPDVWGGRHAMRILFRAVTDLDAIRRRTAALAVSAGLERPEREAVVSAVHEASVIALAAHDTSERRGSGRCALDAWLGTNRLVVHVEGPGLDSGAARGEAGLPGPPDLAAAAALDTVDAWCRPAQVTVRTDARRTRITAGHP